MSEKTTHNKEEIYSRVLRAGRRTYFFDVRATKANDYYLTITESKKHDGQNGDSFYKKHKVYLYKEDFPRFKEILGDVMGFIIDEKGEEVISERHNPDFKQDIHPEEDIIAAETLEPASASANEIEELETEQSKTFTDVNFEEI